MHIAAEMYQTPHERYIPASSVDDYLSASRNNDPLLYPGTRPDASYITDGVNVYTLHATGEGQNLRLGVDSYNGTVDVDDFLRDHTAAPLEDRIPVLAFGANMCPGSLAKKFEKVGRPDALVVPTVYGSLRGYDVVWSGGPSANGNFTANLYQGEETAATEVQVGINFLTPEQLLVMHATELNYDLSTIKVTVGNGSLWAYYYAGKDSVHVQNGRPVAVEGVPANGRTLATATTTEMLDDMLNRPGILEPLYSDYPELRSVHTAGEYIAYVQSFSTKAGQSRLTVKQRLNECFVASGHAKVASADIDSRRLANWANPSMLRTYGQWLAGIAHPNLYILPSQVISPDAWPNSTARNKVLKSITAHLVRTSRQVFEADEGLTFTEGSGK